MVLFLFKKTCETRKIIEENENGCEPHSLIEKNMNVENRERILNVYGKASVMER